MYSFLGRLWDWVVYLKGLCITSLIVPFKLSSSNSQIEVVDFTTSFCESRAFKNNNKGSHEVSSKNKPSINLEFIEWFVGISEAESNFLCRVRKNKEGIVAGFEFVFRIILHSFLCFTQSSCWKIYSWKGYYLCITSKKILGERDLHTLSVESASQEVRISSQVANENGNSIAQGKINNYYISGFIDAEGSFSVLCTRSKKMKLGWRIIVNFQIHLHKRDLELLIRIKEALGGVGSIYNHGSKDCSYMVHSLLDLTNSIIPHFDKYPLLTKKREDYEFFKQVVQMMNNKEHLTEQGFKKILSIKASMRNGLTNALVETFPNIIPVANPVVESPSLQSINPNWIVGFTEGEGCFMIHVQKHSECKLGKAVKLIFQITQHERDKELLNLIILYFNCGTLKTDNHCKVLTVTKFEDVYSIIIPFFQKYPLQGVKQFNFIDFIKAAELIKDKAHLTHEGLEKILFIKSGMNSGRDYSSHSD